MWILLHVLYEFWSKIVTFRVEIGQGVVLYDYVCHFRYRTQLGSNDLVDEMTKGTTVLFMFLLLTQHRQLQLALSFVSKQKVDENIVVLSLKPVFYPNYLQQIWIACMKFVNNLHNFDEFLLRTWTLASHYVSNLESHQINWSNDCSFSIVW